MMKRLSQWWNRPEEKVMDSHIWQSLATYAQQGLGLILGVILARLLGPGEFGIYAYAVAVTTLVMLPFTWSLGPVLISDGGKSPGLFEQVLSFTWGVAIIRIGVTLILSLYFWFKGESLLAVLCGIMGILEALREIITISMAELNGRGLFKPNFQAELTSVLAAFLLAIPAAWLGWGALALLLPSLGSLISYAWIFHRFSQKSLFKRPTLSAMEKHAPPGVWLWLNNIAQAMFTRMDNWMVGHYLGMNALGNYNRAFNYSPISHMALGSLAGNPTLSSLARTSTPGGKMTLFIKSALVLLAAGIVNWAILFYFSDPLVVWIFGDQWKGAIPLFKCFAGFSLCLACLHLPLTLLFAAGKYRETGLVRLAGCVLFVAILIQTKDSLTAVQVGIWVQLIMVGQGVILGCLAFRGLISPSPAGGRA